jgi:hypothetical protein
MSLTGGPIQFFNQFNLINKILEFLIILTVNIVNKLREFPAAQH